ncbi:hypothetical protein CAPTEDRAFT_199477 [Capitella teleta]|uniref:Uncharacterized protein n=1 Tax=Capitella teleta TaxID=283909 RepID=R7VFR6_CAPTE|nr:hypothetical protein CAPTEDRAFT_199477 [Capitella teleta]|eukprot:ELU14525.1 hypothetical protein CAPTEDRAFT_199477 [Capitella teleta]
MKNFEAIRSSIKPKNLEAKKIQDMTKEKMNERVMEVGKEEWMRSLQSTELTKKYAVEKETVKLESYADGCVGAKVRMLLRKDCLPVRTHSCVDCGEEDGDCMWRKKERERERVRGACVAGLCSVRTSEERVEGEVESREG